MFFKILLFDFWDSGLFFEKLGNFIDISVVVLVSMEFGLVYMYLCWEFGLYVFVLGIDFLF